MKLTHLNPTMNATQKKHKAKTIPQLRKKAGEVFRRWIRQRDEGQGCISCGSYSANQAGHYYSAGHYPALEFEEDNVHLQCLRCNYHLHGNLAEYRKRLLNKIGQERLDILDQKASQYKRNGYKHDRFFLIEIIEKYK